MKRQSDKEQRFLAVTDSCKEIIAKVCLLYASPSAPFEDLYQEVLVSLWLGLDSFRGEAKMSTWIYRTALNTCITWHRTSGRHNPGNTLSLDSLIVEPADGQEAAAMKEELAELNRLVARLGPIDKALITLWLDEKPYDEISHIMGLSEANIAVRIHRIKEKLSRFAAEDAEGRHTL